MITVKVEGQSKSTKMSAAQLFDSREGAFLGSISIYKNRVFLISYNCICILDTPQVAWSFADNTYSERYLSKQADAVIWDVECFLDLEVIARPK